MHLVVGLGNPGKRYEKTRHNAGFLVVDRLCARWYESCDKKQLGALVGSARVGNDTAVLAKPQTFMNLSGQPTASLRGFYKVDVPKICVVHDEVDLPLGRVKLKRGGGHGGHNGLRDIQAKLGTNEFVRVRLGVGRPPKGWDTADYVLGSFSAEETQAVEEAVEQAADAVELWIREGLEAAMNRIHTQAA